MTDKPIRRNGNGESSGGNPPRKIAKSQTVPVVQSVLLSELKKAGQGTIELVHAKCVFEKEAGHLIGIAVNALARSKHILRVDLRHSLRRQAHGRFVSVWRLAD